MSVEMEAIDSALISHRGYDPEQQLLYIRFRSKVSIGPLYLYGNISAATYSDAIAYTNDKGVVSFGQYMNRYIKADPKRFPFRKLEEAGGAPSIDSVIEKLEQTTDFASGQPIPATTPDVIVPILADIDELKKTALELNAKAKAIVINSSDACELAMRLGITIAQVRDVFEKNLRPGIKEKHAAWQAELAILNHYDKPLEADQARLKEGIIKYRQDQKRIADAESKRQREEAQRAAEAEATKQAEQLKLDDAIEAESRGEIELAESIMQAPALPLQAAYVPPVYVTMNVPSVKGASNREKWVYEYVDENGNPSVDGQGNPFPRMDLIPMEYHLPDEKALGAIATRLKNRSNVAGIRVYDAGNVAFSKKV